MTIVKAATIGQALNQTREQSRRTIDTLITWHHARIAEIDEGHRYYRRGEDITAAMRKRHVTEIEMCSSVIHAMEHMSAGDIKRAADLCQQINEHIPNVQ